jgi:hypothetical protein
VLKRLGQLERADLMNDALTVHEVGRIAISRFTEAQAISVATVTTHSKTKVGALQLLSVQLAHIMAWALGNRRPHWPETLF